MKLSLDLPLCPSTNALYCNRARGRAKTTTYRNWLKAAQAELWTQKPAGGFPFFAGDFHVLIAVALTMRGDVDNRQKAAIDFLKRGAGVIPDDKRAHAAHVIRDASVQAGRCRVTISDEPLMVAA